MKNLIKSLAIVCLSGIITLNIQAGEKEKPAANSVSITLSGQVIDKESGEALTGVAIVMENSDKVVYSDFEGYFSFVNVTPGEYKLKAMYVSYEDEEKMIKSNAGSKSLNVKFEMISQE